MEYHLAMITFVLPISTRQTEVASKLITMDTLAKRTRKKDCRISHVDKVGMHRMVTLVHQK